MATTVAGWTGSEVFGTTSPASGVAPSAATDGQPLQDLEGITVVVASASGTTLSGAGTLDCYLYDPSVGIWARHPSGDFSAPTASLRATAYEPVIVSAPRKGARVKWIPTGITFSAGSAGVTVYQLGSGRDIAKRYDR